MADFSEGSILVEMATRRWPAQRDHDEHGKFEVLMEPQSPLGFRLRRGVWNPVIALSALAFERVSRFHMTAERDPRFHQKLNKSRGPVEFLRRAQFLLRLDRDESKERKS